MFIFEQDNMDEAEKMREKLQKAILKVRYLLGLIKTDKDSVIKDYLEKPNNFH